MKSRVFYVLLAGLAVLASVLIINALTLPNPQRGDGKIHPLPQIDIEGVSGRLGEIIRIRTVSYQDRERIDETEFQALHQWLEQTYPTAHRTLKREVINGQSLLYTWAGSDSSLKPVLLMAHTDVVPIQPGTEENWEHPPFSGAIDGDYVWGRGALDDKSPIVGMMEAIETLSAGSFRPQRSLYFSFGHDEEIGGQNGAAKVAETLAERQIELDWTLDEGGFVTTGMNPSVSIPIVAINVAEKGYASFEIVARGEGGHSSMPPAETAVGRLAKAITTLESNQFPVRFQGLVRESLQASASLGDFKSRLVMSNLWLFKPLVEKSLRNNPMGNALVRTTIAPTMLSASPKENVLAAEARGIVNIRIAPGDTADSVRDRLESLIKGENVAVEVKRAGNPSKVSATDSEGYALLLDTAFKIYPDAAAVPGLLMAGTDTKHFERVAVNNYRFSPIVVTPQDGAIVHGTNERISIANLERMVQYYLLLIEQL